MCSLGINIAFPPKRLDSFKYYVEMLSQAAEQNLNVCRLWLSDFSFNGYRARGLTYDFNMDLLADVTTYGGSRGIKFIPVLFDFNELTRTNVHWSDYEHTFGTSFLCNYFSQPRELFSRDNLDIALGKYAIVIEAIGDQNVAGWELFNEIDLTEGFEIAVAQEWIKGFSDELRKHTEKPIYFSVANPRLVDAFSDIGEAEICLHTYRWPYDQVYKNVIYWQARFPDTWITEFGDPNAAREELLLSLVASFLLNNNRKAAVPWYWESVLSKGVYFQFADFLNRLGQFIRPGEEFRFTGNLGTSNSLPRITDMIRTMRLAGWKSALSKAVAKIRVLRPYRSKTRLLNFDSIRQTIQLSYDQATNVKATTDQTTVQVFHFGRLKIASTLRNNNSFSNTL